MSAKRFTIKEIKARQILDSRGEPTVECDVITDEGMGRAAIPSGASRGKREALELRDGTAAFHGKGVRMAVENIRTDIAPQVEGMDCRKQEKIDNLMIKLDGTQNKQSLGANAILAVSLAAAKAAAAAEKIPLFQYLRERAAYRLPVPVMNLINGGTHAGNELAIQEFWVLPIGVTSFSDAIRTGCEIYYTLEEVLERRFGGEATNVGDEGGFAPPLGKTNKAMEILAEVVEESGFELGREVFLGMDAAATNFYSPEEKEYEIDGKRLQREGMIEYYKKLTSRYPIIAIEDPLFEEDFKGFAKLTTEMGENVLIVGDDIFVTTPQRLKRGIDENAANSLILKPNQVGTLTETIKVAEIAREANYKRIMSHRSGETTDTFISDLAVALNTTMIKTGAPARGERVCKYNRLLRIEERIEEPKYPDLTSFL